MFNSIVSKSCIVNIYRCIYTHPFHFANVKHVPKSFSTKLSSSMELLPSECAVEKQLETACQWRSAESDIPISYYQAVYVRIQNHIYPGCRVCNKDNQYFLQIETLSLSESAHEERVKKIMTSLNVLDRDYFYPKSIDVLYMDHYSQDVSL